MKHSKWGIHAYQDYKEVNSDLGTGLCVLILKCSYVFDKYDGERW